MKARINLKSALVGLVVGVIAMVAIGATEGESTPVGRYQAVCGTDRLMLIVDTATGQAWAIRPEGLSVSGSPGGFFDKKVDK